MARLRHKIADIRSRLTGFSLPFVGASWQPAPAERDVILRLFSFLENRRVLYVPVNFEVPDEVDRSVIQIRDELTRLLNDLPEASTAAGRVRHLRQASRHFMTGPHPEYRNIEHAAFGNYDPPSTSRRRDRRLSPGYFVALGELRLTFGIQLAALAVEFDIEPEDDLFSIFPGAQFAE